ncbi:MAG TPA: ribonuclease HII [Thermoplasmata archaeon]|nr:ribonuclease HII [Thermoplasmata archaeon]
MLGARPPTLVGIDEAGRGAWIGPLVVGAVAVPREASAGVAATGARDSKTLSPVRREEVLARLERCASLRALEAEPAEIDRHVAGHRLNELEARLFGRLAREFAPAEARVDACDANARRFGASVAHHAGPHVVVLSRHRADALDPLVGAASIVAKVRRDRAIRDLAAALGEEVGSGYPSDPVTVAFVRRYVRRADARPPWLRSSWATTRRVIGGPGPTRRLGAGRA